MKITRPSDTVNHSQKKKEKPKTLTEEDVNNFLDKELHYCFNDN